PASSALYTLSLPDALPISRRRRRGPTRRACGGSRRRRGAHAADRPRRRTLGAALLRLGVLDRAPVVLDLFGERRALALLQLRRVDRKSTRLNSSHVSISYA